MTHGRNKDDSEAITSLFERASKKIREELIGEIGMIMAREPDRAAALSEVRECYDRLVAPLIRDVLLMEMRFGERLDRVGKILEEMENKGPATP